MVIDLFKFTDYHKYLQTRLKAMPREGFGEMAKIAKALNVSPANITLIFSADKFPTLEQAEDLAQYLLLNELESDYFFYLVLHARAGNQRLRKKAESKLKELRDKSKTVQNRLPPDATLSESAKATFYSHWYYSAICLLTSIEGFDSVEKIEERLRLPRTTIKQALDFLIEQRLVVVERGKYQMGIARTHLAPESPLIARLHANWRLRLADKSALLRDDEFQFSGPVVLAQKDFQAVREILLKAVEESFKVIHPSPSEELGCLNIDWVRV